MISKPRNLMNHLLNRFMLIYGQSINHPTLRYALCAIQGRDNEDFQTEQEYIRRVRETLRVRLNQPADLDEGDLFSIFYLIWLSSPVEDCFDTHVYGLTSLLKYFAKWWSRYRNSPLKGFWPVLVTTVFSMVSSGDHSRHCQSGRNLVYNLHLALGEINEFNSMKANVSYPKHNSDIKHLSNTILFMYLNREYVMLRLTLEFRCQRQTPSGSFYNCSGSVAMGLPDVDYVQIIQSLNSECERLFAAWQNHDVRSVKQLSTSTLPFNELSSHLRALFHVHLSRILLHLLNSPSIEENFASLEFTSAFKSFHSYMVSMENFWHHPSLWDKMNMCPIENDKSRQEEPFAVLFRCN